MAERRILLLNPPSHRPTESISPDYMSHGSEFFHYPPLGLLYLAANLPAEFDCRVVDALAKRFSIADCLDEVKRYQPSVVGLSVFTDNWYAVADLTDSIKVLDSKIKVVLGGAHVRVFPSQTAGHQSVDYVLTGFAENTFASLMSLIGDGSEPSEEELRQIPGLWWNVRGTIRKSDTQVDPRWDIDEVKGPDRTLVDLEDYFTAADNKRMTTMISSRGCPFKCTFCDVPEKRFFPRNLNNLIGEIREILAMGIEKIHFLDDCFNVQRRRVIDLCRLLIREDLKVEWSFRGRIAPCDDELVALMKEAGCTRVHLGVEGTDQETIDIIRKQIDIARLPDVLTTYRRHSILTLGYFIIGFPHQSLTDCEASCEKMQRIGFDFIQVFVFIPYPGTQAYQELLEQKAFDRDYWMEHALSPKADFHLPLWRSSDVRSGLHRLVRNCYRAFYLSPRFIVSEIRRTIRMRKLLTNIRVAFSMLRR